MLGRGGLLGLRGSDKRGNFRSETSLSDPRQNLGNGDDLKWSPPLLALNSPWQLLCC